MSKSIKTWRREERATGLMRVTQGERSWEYGTKGTTYVWITGKYEKFEGRWLTQWTVSFFCTIDEKRKILTLKKRFQDIEEAKRAGRAWYEANLDKFKGEFDE